MIALLWFPSQCNAMGCRVQQYCAALVLLSPKAVVSLVIAAIHPSGAAVAYSMGIV